MSLGTSKSKGGLTQVQDKDGHTSTHYLIPGTDILLPPFPNLMERFEELQQLKAREDDVLICGYPKCGTHWVWEKAGMLINGQAEYIMTIKESLMLEAVSNATLDALPSPRILNTHISPEFIPRQFFEKKCKIVYLLRNPKDMLVSMYNHTFNLLPFYGYDGKWSGYFEFFMEGKVDYGDWFRYVLGWEEFISSRPDLPIHTIYYEDMKKDSVRETDKLSVFLKEQENPELSKLVAEKCSFSNMKTAKSAFDDEVEKADWRDGKPLMYRKGQVGDWKNWFTVIQNERLEERIRNKLSSTKLRYTFEQ